MSESNAQPNEKASAAKHTPGPWRESPGVLGFSPNGWRGVFAGDVEVATVWVSSDVSDITDEQCKANTRLIAAAPDLLEACLAALPILMVAQAEANKRLDNELAERCAATRDYIEAAIAKAVQS